MKLTQLEELQGSYSDLHKDVYGFRPRGCSENFNSVKWLESELSFLCTELDKIQAEEEAVQHKAIFDFEEKVNEMIKLGAKTRQTALKWLFDAEADEYVSNDPDYFCYLNNLPYGYFKGEMI